MKLCKKLLSVLLAMLMLIPMAALLPAQAASTLDLRVTPFSSDKTVIKAWYNKNDGSYDLFLPADADASALKVNFTGGDTLTVGDVTLHDGDVTDAFAADESYAVSVGENSFTVKCYQSANIPSVYIQTESGSLDYIHANKENKEKAVITTVENGEIDLDGAALKQMKGRGNATWGLSKKPYNIKFDKKTKLLGMPKAKKWTLLASYLDSSLLRNPTAWEMANLLGLAFSSEYRHVDLYVNGAYLGNYILCESVEIGSDRVDIHDLSKDNESANPDVDIESLPASGTGADGAVQSASVKGSRKWVSLPNEPENVTGGYLLECEFGERYNNEISGFVSNAGQCVVVKEPEYASEAEVAYVSAFWNAAEAALLSPTGYNAEGKHYSEYFDVPMLAKMYLLEEFAIDVDAGQSSCYFYLDRDADKFVASPVWDFDHAMGDPYDARYGLRIGDPSIWYVNSLNYTNSWGGASNTPTVFRLAYRHEDFRDVVSAAWQAFNDADGVAQLTAFEDALASRLSASGAMNAIRWNHFSAAAFSDNQAAYANMVQTGTHFQTQRAQYLNKGFSADAAMIYYDNNGGAGLVFEPSITLIGDTVTVLNTDARREGIAAPNGQTFDGWNTAPDGSGTAYQPGDQITLTARTTTLYAQWRPMTTGETIKEKNRSFWQKIKDFFVKMWKAFVSIFE
ncbi:MAG: CotH kinase family protein [Clostridia bacterium]|nr:CotH kinase family protein [Clostridia bacterium]